MIQNRSIAAEVLPTLPELLPDDSDEAEAHAGASTGAGASH
jgi:hypothetical protein